MGSAVSLGARKEPVIVLQDTLVLIALKFVLKVAMGRIVFWCAPVVKDNVIQKRVLATAQLATWDKAVIKLARGANMVTIARAPVLVNTVLSVNQKMDLVLVDWAGQDAIVKKSVPLAIMALIAIYCVPV
ncbi:hypothetical protein NDU88_001036 [Pleurodeles waltl]|uniref:Uncharacterized protein n=1 Tax=Pleurodeles waltl TaxID=8319 RepID=A0AAV7LK91_PLEWA|nr:hypothetical protein NDU88_001036 [Pleurodeles waltl]